MLGEHQDWGFCTRVYKVYTAAKMIEETVDTFRTDAQSTLDWYTAVCIDLTNSKQKVLCT